MRIIKQSWMKTLADRLAHLSPCEDVIEWLRQYTPKQGSKAYRECQRGDWLAWLWSRCVKQGSPEHKKLVWACCQIARTILPLTTQGVSRIAVETTEAWTRGEATLDQVKSANYVAFVSSANPAATNAALTATASIAYYAAAATANYAAAHATAAHATAAFADDGHKSLANSADLIRQSLPKPPKITRIGKRATR